LFEVRPQAANLVELWAELLDTPELRSDLRE
jgi:hypothetical protein